MEEALFLSDRIYVMTPRPGRIENVERMNWNKPRSRSILTSSEFMDIKTRILSRLMASGVVA